jgi:DNA-binding IclR family transcriptional regulator
MDESDERTRGAYYVSGLQRGLRVLEVVALADRPLGLSDVADRLSIPPSSAFRLIYTLRDMGFLEVAEDTKSVRIGARVLNIGFAYLARMEIPEIARPELESLRDRTDVTAHLAIRDGRELLYLCCVQTRSGFLSTMNVGARLPVYATPMGWLLLGDLGSEEVSVLLNGIAWTPLTTQTPCSLAELVRRIEGARIEGLVISHGSFEPGGSSISAPVRDHGGKMVAAIDIAGPDSAFDLAEFTTRYVTETLDAAARISRRLGYRG